MNRSKEKRNPLVSCLKVLLTIICGILLPLAFISILSANWYIRVFGHTGFDSVLYTVFSKVDAAGPQILRSFLKRALAPGLALGFASWCALFLCSRNSITLVLFKKKLKFHVQSAAYAISRIAAVVLSLTLIYTAADKVEMVDYVLDLLHPTTFLQTEYVDPNKVEITFPEKKQNLIYIFLESMENTFFSQEQGGAGEVCYIPELYQMAENNINFSQNSSVGGGRDYPGATWTIGAMVSQTAGIPLKVPLTVEGNSYAVSEEDPFLPGVTSIMDILDKNGYTQGLMVGSYAMFGGRQAYYKQHGIDQVWDLFTAREEGLIPEDYFEGWGYEDLHLFEYAKEKITDMASSGEPFSFTMLTVDTHHIDGYFCRLCEDKYEEQYQNVYACSSKQVTEFVAWLQQQDFAENTTIIVTGDHNSMDAGYMERNVSPSYVRRIYNCFINPNTDVSLDVTKNREFVTLDMFPTTLAALGCTIEGNRLGHGTNLFSGEKTLVERYGYDVFCQEISKKSNFYDREFLQYQK